MGKALIAIYNLGGRFYATRDTCTHEKASLCDGFIEGETIECPLHQAVFHIPTGKAMSEPARSDLKVCPVKVENAGIHVEVPAA